MKKLLLAAAVLPLLLCATAGVGTFLCVALHGTSHPREMLVALVACLLCAELSLAPLWLTIGATQATVSQAGLGATAAHLLLCAFVGLFASTQMHLGQPFLYWLLAFYWISLAVVAVTATRQLRAAPITRIGAMP